MITIEDYLAEVPFPARETLDALLALIREIVPDAEECIYYGMPTFNYHGPLVGFAAFKKHHSFFPLNGHTVSQFEEQLTGYKTSIGAIQFPHNKPLPEQLVRDIIEFRIAENKATKKKK